MIELQRVQGWRGNMAAYHEQTKKRVFDWATFDCARFANGHIEVITGRKLTFAVGDYDTPLGAMKALKSLGYVSLLDLAEKNLPPIKLPLMRVGDIVLVNSTADTDAQDATGWATGVCHGERVWLMSPQGYGSIARSDSRVSYAFKVG